MLSEAFEDFVDSLYSDYDGWSDFGSLYEDYDIEDYWASFDTMIDLLSDYTEFYDTFGYDYGYDSWFRRQLFWDDSIYDTGSLWWNVISEDFSQAMESVLDLLSDGWFDYDYEAYDYEEWVFDSMYSIYSDYDIFSDFDSVYEELFDYEDYMESMESMFDLLSDGWFDYDYED